MICRVVRAVLVLGAGLGFPVGETFGFAPPTSDDNRKTISSTVAISGDSDEPLGHQPYLGKKLMLMLPVFEEFGHAAHNAQ